MPKSAIGTSATATDDRLRRPGARGPERTSGFTLFEMLVVLAIIGLVAASVLLSLNLTGRDPALHTAGRRLFSLMRYARNKAELETRDYGIVFDRHGYAFVVFSARHNEWRIAQDDQALRPRRLPSGVTVTVQVDGREVKLPAQLPKVTHAADATSDPGAIAPQVMLYSSGDLSSFAITLERPASQRGFLIKPNQDGRIVEQPLTGQH